MKLVDTVNAAGLVLCHDLTQIIPGEFKGPRFKKGHIIVASDIPVLLSMGKEHLYVWEPKEGFLHEDEGAERLAALCENEHMTRGETHEGKIDLFAACDGLFKVRRDALRRVNGLSDIMIASQHSNTPVKAGDKLLGTRVIPLMIDEKKLDAAAHAAGATPLFSLLPYQIKTAGIIVTGSEVEKGLIEDKFSDVVRQKFAEFEVSVIDTILVGDDPARCTAAIHKLIEQGAEIVVCTGGMSVDPDDKTPLGIRSTGAEIISYGAPVLPGAMFLLAYYGPHRVPVCGLPGCVMYSKRTIFDLVLPRLVAYDPIDAAQLAALGEGGLCLNCPVCIYPKCGFGKGH